MSGIAKVVLPVVQKLWPLLVQHWPKVVQAFIVANDWLRDHPNVPAWFRSRLEHLQKQFAEAAKKRGTSAQIRAALAVVRNEVALSGALLDKQQWLDRADAIEQGLRIAELREGAKKKASLADLKERTDELAGDLVIAVMQTRPREAAPPDSGTA